MAYDEGLAERVRQALQGHGSISERKMFGGLAFMLNGNMCVGVEKDNLMVRVGPDKYEEALDKSHARLMDFTGRPMKGFVYVTPEGVQTDPALKEWVAMGTEFAGSLPPK